MGWFRKANQFSQTVREGISQTLTSRDYRHLGNQLYHTRMYRQFNNGVEIFEKDWDVLVLLDACRYDTFVEQYWSSNLDEALFESVSLDRRESMGSNTREWLKGNFTGRDLTDTVYVTANPMLMRIWDSVRPEFHDVVNVWQTEGWDDEFNTVLPETMVEHSIRVAERYPRKRLLVHFVQPHFPFLTQETQADKIRPDPASEGSFWVNLQSGDLGLDRATVESAYSETLAKTLPHVWELVQEVQGKTVVTSDHGELFDEAAYPFFRRYWGHPRGIYVDSLVSVPWLTIETGERRDFVSGRSRFSIREFEDRNLEERLGHLGYTV